MLIPTIDRRPVSRGMARAVGMLGLAVLLPLAGAAAQMARATVSGSVSDAHRGHLPGVTLTLTHTASGARHDARIGTDGLVEDVRVVSASDPAFASAATDAVSRWEFDATLLNCLPMTIEMMVSVRFGLEP